MKQFDEAAQIRERFNRTLEQVRNDVTLSDQGKSEKITAAWQDAAGKMNAIRQSIDAEIQTELTRLHKSAFGLVFAPMAPVTEKMAITASYRDAVDRAERLEKPQDALRLLRNAELANDVHLAKAVARKAHELSWDGVLQEHGRVWRDQGSTVTQLRELEATVGTSNRMQISMQLSLTRPNEVAVNAQPAT